MGDLGQDVETTREFMNTWDAANIASREIRRWNCLLDNRERSDDFGFGFGIAYTYANTGDDGFMLWPDVRMKQPVKAVYIMDFGDRVLPYYVTGWQTAEDGLIDRVFLGAFPVNGKIRPDNGRPADYSNWKLGPRKAYHLKVTNED